MSRLGPFAHYLSQLSTQLDIARWGSYQLDTLTPEVAHASAMLLGLAVRGDLNRPVIRRLVSLLDGKTQVLREALAYLEQVDQDQAIEAITDCLDTEQLAFVLTQTQDVMLDVQEPTDTEQAIFDRLRERYDGSSALLSTSLVTIKHKNALSSLGPFELAVPGTASKPAITSPATLPPPQILAESLLRITVADSVVDPQQLAYMGEVIARYPGLQNLAVQQARKVTTEQFILQVRGLLTPNQALCVLCQCAHLIFIEGRGSQPKWQVFRQLRDAWGLSERDMVVHLGTLKFNACKLLSRRDENAQPSAWGMRQDDWAAMKNGQGRPATRGPRGVQEEEGDVIRRSGDEGVGAAAQRPRGASAMHRGPIPAARAPASTAPAPAGGGSQAAPARTPAPARSTPPAAVSSPTAAVPHAPLPDKSPARSPVSASDAAPTRQERQEVSTPTQDVPEAPSQTSATAAAQESVPSDPPLASVEPSAPEPSNEPAQVDTRASDADMVADAVPSASDASPAAEPQANAQAPQEASQQAPVDSADAHPAPVERASGSAPAHEPAAVPQAAPEAAAAPSQATPASPTSPTSPAAVPPGPASDSQAPAAASVTPSTAAAPAGGPNAGSPAPAAASAASGDATPAAQAPSPSAPAASAASPADKEGPRPSSAGRESRERSPDKAPESATARHEPDASAHASDASDRSTEASPSAKSSIAAQADTRGDLEKSAGAGHPQGSRQDVDAPSVPPSSGAHASAPAAAAPSAEAATGQSVPAQATGTPAAMTAGSPSAPAVAQVPVSSDAASPASVVADNRTNASPATPATAGKTGDNVQSLTTDGASPHRQSVQGDDAQDASVPVGGANASQANAQLADDARMDALPGATGSAPEDASQAVESAPALSNQVTVPNDHHQDRFLGAESDPGQEEELVCENTADSDARVKLAIEPAEAHHEAVDEPVSPDNLQTLEADASSENLQALDAAAEVDNRQTWANDVPEPNRQRVDLPQAAGDNHQRIPDGSNADKLLPQVKSSPGRVLSSPPRRETEQVHTRVFESWQSVAQKEPEVVRKKAGFSSQIPPTIHRQRVIDFSSINVFLDYEDDPKDKSESQDANGAALEKKRDYDYKLQTCLDILRQQQALVNDKLQRVQTRR